MSLHGLPDGSVVLTAGDEPPGDGPFETIQFVTKHNFGMALMCDGTFFRFNENYTKGGKLDTRTSRYYVNGQRVGRDIYQARYQKAQER